jgi:hypothetical protein
MLMLLAASYSTWSQTKEAHKKTCSVSSGNYTTFMLLYYFFTATLVIMLATIVLMFCCKI